MMMSLTFWFISKTNETEIVLDLESRIDANYFLSLIIVEDPAHEDKVYLNSRFSEAVLALGFLYFGYNVLRPEDINGLVTAPGGPILPPQLAAVLGLPPNKGRSNPDQGENQMFNAIYEMMINR